MTHEELMALAIDYGNARAAENADSFPARDALANALREVVKELETSKKSEVERLLRIEVKVDALIAERDALQAKLEGTR